MALSGGVDMRLKIWSVENGSCPRTLVGHRAGLYLVVLYSLVLVEGGYHIAFFESLTFDSILGRLPVSMEISNYHLFQFNHRPPILDILNFQRKNGWAAYRTLFKLDKSEFYYYNSK